MARYSDHNPYQGKGQKSIFARIESLQNRFGVEFDDVSDFETKTVATFQPQYLE